MKKRFTLFLAFLLFSPISAKTTVAHPQDSEKFKQELALEYDLSLALKGDENAHARLETSLFSDVITQDPVSVLRYASWFYGQSRDSQDLETAKRAYQFVSERFKYPQISAAEAGRAIEA